MFQHCTSVTSEKEGFGFRIGRINKLSTAAEYSYEQFSRPISTHHGENAKELPAIS